ncbi:MAG: cysteine hydrolase family protein [Polyangiales bacterium]
MHQVRPILGFMNLETAFVALSLSLALVGCTPHDRPGPTLRTMYSLAPIDAVDPRHTALVLVDFQEEFFHGKLEVASAESAAAHARELLAWARHYGVAVFHVRNVARPGAVIFAPGSPTLAFAKDVGPIGEEPVLTKPTGGAFTKTDLDAQLHARGIDTIVIGGIMAHLAVAMSAQDAAVLGYRVIVASDATTTRSLPGAAGGPPVDADTVLRTSLAIIADRFADVMTSEKIRSLPLR